MGVKSVAFVAISERADASHAGVTHSRGMCKGLAQNGVAVTLYFSANRFARVERDGFTEVHLPRRGVWKPWWGEDDRAWKRAREQIRSADVVHERYSVNPLSHWLSDGRRVVLEVNDPLEKTWGPLKRLAFAPLIARKKRRAVRVITQTQSLKRLLSPEFGVPVEVVPNGVDLDVFAPDAARGEAWKARHGLLGSRVVAFVGSFRDWHGVQHAVEMAKCAPGAVFVLAGDGPLRARVENKASQAGLADRVRLLGSVSASEVAELLCAAEVAIAPFDVSDNPALSAFGFWWCPVKLFEYLGAGVPVVASDFEEVRAIVREAGVLVAPGSVQAAGQAVAELLGNDVLRKKLRERALALRESFSWRVRARETVNIYNSLGSLGT